MRTFLAGLVLSLVPGLSFSQAVVKGLVSDARTRAALPFVNVLLDGTTQGATTDIDGISTIDAIHQDPP